MRFVLVGAVVLQAALLFGCHGGPSAAEPSAGPASTVLPAQPLPADVSGLVALVPRATPTLVWDPRPAPQGDPWEFRGLGPAARFQVSCFDVTGDRRIDLRDAAAGPPDVDGDGEAGRGDAVQLGGVQLALREDGCRRPDGYEAYADYLVQRSAGGLNCTRGQALLLILVGGSGTNLANLNDSVSQGLRDLGNALVAAAGDIPVEVVAAASAIEDARSPQAAMERWLRRALVLRLEAFPCLRAVLVGHSHGGALVGSIAASVERPFPDRLFVVAIDRTVVLFDHADVPLPLSTPLLNVFQTVDGWHGDALPGANVENIDATDAWAPERGHLGGDMVPVNHNTLDDAPAVQRRIVAAVQEWLRPR